MKKVFLLFLSVVAFEKAYSQIAIRNSVGDVIAFESLNGNIKSAIATNVNVGGVLDSLSSDSLENNLNNSNTIIESSSMVNTDTLNSVPFLSMGNDSTIVTLNGSVIATFKNSTKEVIDGDERKIFRINANNEILNAGDVILGRIDEEGKVYEASGNLIGQGDGVSIFKLAYFFFYSNK